MAAGPHALLDNPFHTKLVYHSVTVHNTPPLNWKLQQREKKRNNKNKTIFQLIIKKNPDLTTSYRSNTSLGFLKWDERRTAVMDGEVDAPFSGFDGSFGVGGAV